MLLEEEQMDTLYERVAGLDVHKDTVVAGVRIMTEDQPTRECRTYSTTTEQVEELRAWLKECGCTHVASEQRVSAVTRDRSRRRRSPAARPRPR